MLESPWLHFKTVDNSAFVVVKGSLKAFESHGFSVSVSFSYFLFIHIFLDLFEDTQLKVPGCDISWSRCECFLCCYVFLLQLLL